jgi:RNA polymerase sigma factor (sigma-70 family)
MPFDTTRWSLITTAQDGEETRSRAALEELFKLYWTPLYAYLRGKGNSEDAARDITQGFFAHLLEKDFLGYVDPDRGKFRTFLLVSLNRYLASEHERDTAQKRNHGRAALSMDVIEAERWLNLEPRDGLTPEKIFEQNWALALMRTALDDVHAYYTNMGSGRKFEILSPHLTSDLSRLPYKAVAEELNTSEGAVKVAIHRLRKRYRDAIREQVRQTLSNPEDLNEELEYLMQIFSKS